MMASQTLPAQNVPAWKRLGLKLKGPASSTPSTPAANGAAAAVSTNGVGTSPGWVNKRKEYPSPASNYGSKRPRTDFGQTAQTPDRRKSVSFADDTKGSDLDPSATKTPSRPAGAVTDGKTKHKKQKKPKARKPPKKPEQNFKPGHLQPQLSRYLREWNTARDAWKFRKNIQTLLIKYAFDPELLPAADFPVFCKYARGLQGASREWLRSSAVETRKKDLEQKGAAGFPEGTKDVESKQKSYEGLVAKMLGPQGAQPRSGNANGKRVRDDYSEEDFVMGGTDETRDPDVVRRFAKRMRAEMVLDEMSDAETETSEATSTTTGTASEGGASTATPSAAEEADKKVKLGESSQKRRRQRKKRTVGEDDDTSSSDESSDSSDDEEEDEEEEEEEDDEEGDSDNESTSSSGTSSSGSDSGSSDGFQSEGTLRRLAQAREALDASSSSSSSSSSGSDSESGEEEL